MSYFTSYSKKIKNSFSSQESNNRTFVKNYKLGNLKNSKLINPFVLETTFGKGNIEGNEFEISFTCNEGESKFSNNTNRKILDFLERKEFINYNYDDYLKCETDHFSFNKTIKKSPENKRNLNKKNEINNNDNYINIWKILFLFLENIFIVFIIFIYEYEKLKIKVINSISQNNFNWSYKYQYHNISELKSNNIKN